MREILFKAKRLDNGEWESGRVIHSEPNVTGIINECFICRGFGDQADVVMIQVDPETVCQYTGLTDKNGNKIWEGDIVKYIPTKTILQVLYINGAFAVTYIPNGYSPINWEIEYEGEDYDFAISNDYLTRLEVIGNIFDNPELLSQ
jgi:uncharacterized phage protein (TIGR01671 family)